MLFCYLPYVTIFSISPHSVESWTTCMPHSVDHVHACPLHDLTSCLPAYLPACLPACWPAGRPTLPFTLPVCCLPTHPPAYLPTRLPTSLPTCLPSGAEIMERENYVMEAVGKPAPAHPPFKCRIHRVQPSRPTSTPAH